MVSPLHLRKEPGGWFRVQAFGLGVWGFVFRVVGSGLRVQGLVSFSHSPLTESYRKPDMSLYNTTRI